MSDESKLSDKELLFSFKFWDSQRFTVQFNDRVLKGKKSRAYRIDQSKW